VVIIWVVSPPVY